MNLLFRRSYSIESAPHVGINRRPYIHITWISYGHTCLPHFFLAAAPRAPSFVRIRRVGRHQSDTRTHHSHQFTVFTAHLCQGLLNHQIAGPTYTTWISYMPPHVYLARSRTPLALHFIPAAARSLLLSFVAYRVGRHHYIPDTDTNLTLIIHCSSQLSHHRQGRLHHHIAI